MKRPIFKKKIYSYFIKLTSLILGTSFLTSCANYKAASLSNLSSEIISTSSESSEKVTFASKAFNKADCKKYLDRDVIKHGYQPVQIYIHNNTNKSYLFSPNRISLPSARAEEVAEKVHTSTAGRATGYGVGSLFLWPLAIPAIIDGVKSSNANEALDNDFACKTAREQIIFPYSRLNMLIFVPKEAYQNTFSITLIDEETQKPKILNTTAK